MVTGNGVKNEQENTERKEGKGGTEGVAKKEIANGGSKGVKKTE